MNLEKDCKDLLGKSYNSEELEFGFIRITQRLKREHNDHYQNLRRIVALQDIEVLNLLHKNYLPIHNYSLDLTQND